MRTLSLALVAALSISSIASVPATAHPCDRSPTDVQQYWSPGWSELTEPLNFSRSKVLWHVSNHALSIKYVLKGATPSAQYQVGMHVSCNSLGSTTFFGTFPTSSCNLDDVQGTTALHYAVELGAVTTDRYGNGCFAVWVSPIASGAYSVKFHTRISVGHNLANGFDHPGAAAVPFQSPGPFGARTSIVIR